MNTAKMEVLVVLDIAEIDGQDVFDKYLKKEGFEGVEGEKFAYRGFSSTPVFNTRAYIFEVFSKAFEIANITKCKLATMIGDNDYEIYLYEKDRFFEEIKV